MTQPDSKIATESISLDPTLRLWYINDNDQYRLSIDVTYDDLEYINLILNEEQSDLLMGRLLHELGYDVPNDSPDILIQGSEKDNDFGICGLKLFINRCYDEIAFWIAQQNYGPLSIFFQHRISVAHAQELAVWLAHRLDWEIEA